MRNTGLVLIACITIFGLSANAAGPTIKCDNTFGPTLNRELTEYFKKPVRNKAALDLALKLCHSSKDGDKPCPIAVAGERTGQISAAAKVVGATIVPIAACLAQHAEGAVQEDLYEILSDLLDRLGRDFYRGYFALSDADRQGAAPLANFVGLTLNADENYEKKQRLLRKRLEVLESADALWDMDQIDAAKGVVQESLRQTRISSTIDRNDKGLSFGPSKFDQEMSQRLVRFKIEDRKGIAGLAERTRQSLGLTYQVELKTADKQVWTLCSPTTNACDNSPVEISKVPGPCAATMADITVRKADGASLWVMTEQHRLFTLNPKTTFEKWGVPVELRDKVGKTLNRWYAPNRTFKIKAISTDLRTVYFSKTIKSSAGTTLGEVVLEIRDTGQSQFVPISKEEQVGSSEPDKYFFLKPQEGEQVITTSSGLSYSLDVLKSCKD